MLYGSGEDDVIATSNYLTLNITPDILIANADSTEISESLYQQLVSEVRVVSSRVDNLASLSEGSTTADAELVDIRVGVDGTTYDSAGNAVRSQIEQNKRDMNIFSDALGIGTTTDYTFVAGGISSDGTVKNSATNRVRSENYIWAKAESTIAVKSSSTATFNVATYSDTATSALLSYRGMSSDLYTVDQDCYIRFGFVASDTTDPAAIAADTIDMHIITDTLPDVHAQAEQNTADIAALSDEASAIKSDLSNLSNVTAESVETTVEVEAEIEYSEENTDCRFTLNSDYTKVATSTSALANYTSIVCDVQEGKTYRIKGFKGSDLRYRRMWAFTDDSANVISASEAGKNTTVTEDATCPSGATKLYVNCASGDGSVTLLNATTKIEYTSKSYTKAETDEKIETHISEYHKHKTCVLMNFDASPNFVSDGRKSLLDQYRIPYTVNISISADGASATYPGSSSGANYIADIIRSGNDFALYSASSTKPDEDADIYNGGDDSVALFETYVREAITIAENYGVFNPTAWFCRYMRTGTAMNQALINCGIKICRGYKCGVTPAESTNEYIKNWNNHDKQYFNMNAQSIKSHGFEDGEISETSIGTKSMIDTAIENGWDIAPFAHGIYDTAEEAEENNGITKTLFENVLAYIRQKIDAGECEAMTFRDCYRLKYPADGGMNDIARERKYSDFKLSQII